MRKERYDGLSVKRLSTVLIIFGSLLFISVIVCAIQASTSQKRLAKITEDYIQTQKDVYEMQKGSDILTEKVRQYVLSGDPQYAKDYFEEANVTKRRDQCVEIIKSAIAATGQGDSASIDMALQKSNELMLVEIRAMWLTSQLYPDDTLPAEILSYQPSAEDLLLSDEQIRDKTYELVFGKDYSDCKVEIRRNVYDTSDSLLDLMDGFMKRCAEEYHNIQVSLITLIIIAAAVFAAIAVSLIFLILKPLATTVDAIENEKHIPYCNSFELNYLAKTYNRVYEENASTKLHLKYMAERDELTGLLNRSVFNNLVEFYKNTEKEIALLFIDVDSFKSVNDTFGHQVGDAALQRVAGLLKICFRAKDFPIRYGGDEFAVLMTEITYDQRDVVTGKIDYINARLKKETDKGEPPLSISVGIAFSAYGFTDDLLERADKALYKTKERGKCGYTFG